MFIVALINHLQKQDVSISLHKELISCKKSQLNDHVYTGEYKVNGDFLEIKFLFFDFSPIVEVKES